MHSLHITHGNIKPDNIMFSPSLKKFVFVDFGVSRIIKEEKGEKTMSGCFGTPQYWSEDMLILNMTNKEGEVDLYKNDEHCLTVTLEDLSRRDPNLMNFHTI